MRQIINPNLPPISQTIQVWWARHEEHYWRSKDELISDIVSGKPTRGHTNVGRPARTYYVDTGCSLEDLSVVVDDRDGWQERVYELHAINMTWWFCTKLYYEC